MYTKTTKKISITVNPYYLEDQSEPEDQHYVWAYQVTINNLGEERVQLKNRYWKIIDSNGEKQEVRGEGVVGEFPVLQPGESFEYTSGTPLKTSNGIMQGFYLMSQDDGEQLKIDIPTFSLDSPYNKKNFH